MPVYQNKVRFIHTADLHLGSSFSGLSQKNNSIAEYLSKATYSAFEEIIKKSIEENIDFLLISGDVFDSEEKNLQAILFFIRCIEKLSQYGIHTYISPGNHDPFPSWESVITLAGDNPPFTLFSPDKVETIKIAKEDEIIAILQGMGFSRRTVRENPSKKFPIRDDFSVPIIGVLHCTIGSPSDHENYAPCTVNDLVSRKYDLWTLGHIHAKQEVKTENTPIIYSGNPQGRSWKEIGPKSCTLITIETTGEISWRYLETDSIRWEKRSINIEGIELETELTDAIDHEIDALNKNYPEKSFIISVTLTGSGPFHHKLSNNSILKELTTIYQEKIFSPPFCYIGQIIDQTYTTFDREELRDNEGIIGDVITVTDLLLGDNGPEIIQNILAPLFQHPILKKEDLDFLSEEEKIQIINRAESLIYEKLGMDDED